MSTWPRCDRPRCRRLPRRRRAREEDLHGGDITGPLVVGRVLSCVDEPQKNGKTIRWCTVDVGPHGQMATEGKHQEIVCGAHNFEVGDLVVVVLPGAVLPGGFAIAARDLRPCLQRDDLRRGRARYRRGPHRDHRPAALSRRGSRRGADVRRRRDRPARAGRGGPRGQCDPGPRLLLLAARHRPGVLARHRLARRRLPRPGLRATRHPPMAASRSGSTTSPHRLGSRLRPVCRPHGPGIDPNAPSPGGCSAG